MWTEETLTLSLKKSFVLKHHQVCNKSQSLWAGTGVWTFLGPYLFSSHKILNCQQLLLPHLFLHFRNEPYFLHYSEKCITSLLRTFVLWLLTPSIIKGKLSRCNISLLRVTASCFRVVFSFLWLLFLFLGNIWSLTVKLEKHGVLYIKIRSDSVRCFWQGWIMTLFTAIVHRDWHLTSVVNPVNHSQGARELVFAQDFTASWGGIWTCTLLFPVLTIILKSVLVCNSSNHLSTGWKLYLQQQFIQFPGLKDRSQSQLSLDESRLRPRQLTSQSQRHTHTHTHRRRTYNSM